MTLRKYSKFNEIECRKKGGNILHKISPEMKENLIAKVDAQFTITLSQLASWLRQEHQLSVSVSTCLLYTSDAADE